MLEKLKGTEQLGELGTDGRILLKCIIEKSYARVCCGTSGSR
jgi:hypothetical protein